MRLLICSLLVCLSVSAPHAAAQSRGIIRVIVPAPVGGQPDMLGRQIAQKLGEKTGSTFLVINRPGATGILGNEVVAKAAPDGSTLLFTPKSYITNTPQVHLRMPYDSLDDLVPVVQTGIYGFALVSHPSVPAKTVKELIALAKTKPGLLTFGSPGVGNSLHISGALFNRMAKVEMLHVPYTGAPAAMNGLLGGHIDLAFSSILVAKPLVETGKVRAIAVTGSTREPLLPHVPTINESGLSGYEVLDWHGMFAPRGTPQSIVDSLNEMVHVILVTREMKETWRNQAITFEPNTPAQFKDIVRRDYERSGNLIRAIGIKPE